MLTSWTATPVASALIGALTAAYLIGVYSRRRSGSPWPAGCLVWWFAAIVTSVVALNSPLAAYAENLFWAHMIVHLLLITVIPALLVAAQPIRLLHSISPRTQTAVASTVSRRPFQLATSPAATVPLYAAVLVTTHLTGFQQEMAQHMWIHHVETAVYVASGYVLLLPLLGNEYVGRHLPFALRAVTIITCMVPDAIVGVTLMMSPHIIAPAYSQSRADWGPTALTDQTAAGAIMWVAGDGLMMILILLIARDWVTTEESSFGYWLDGIRARA
ncbi:Cytochrome c oxidase caa3-type, assembly factor CtaG-related protein [Gordonia neofelifaecis NRRL B-59395]|uniref:Cytochrome c oxidase caa3-type, assembly factor CtaG-related protein n=1 Tax=Gordonia neofelifaecis NRRL B-59395 TaxID=644548 RepID=F1YPX5_9ACTN|nr:Cytochrome c oxidase caa3-type, assembly factor CtaG-related protein [Gordonia neofelifaecis NRRL B-59395]